VFSKICLLSFKIHASVRQNIRQSLCKHLGLGGEIEMTRMSEHRKDACCEDLWALKRDELDKECLMQTLYDPQDILKILRSPEQAKSASVFMLLKSLVLHPYVILKNTLDKR